jgi:sec-independent protein translocase protein TatC
LTTAGAPQEDPMQDQPEAPKTPDTDHVQVDQARMSLVEHLSELRQRLRNAAIVFLIAVIGSFYFVKQYFGILTRPARAAWIVALPGQEPVFRFISPTEPFWVYTKLAMYGALLVASPFVFWELWKFVAPGLYRKEKKMALLVTLATAACFIGGALFGYLVLCKPALTYLLSFAEVFPGDLGFKIEPSVMMNEVVGFMLGMLLGTGVAFELPVILGVMGWMGIVTSKGLLKFDKYALVLSTVVGGMLTPGPDILSQVLMAGPLFLLFNLSIVIVWLIERTNRKRLENLEKETGADLVPSGD